ncbi:MAG: Holliday junction resolvase RuvX [Balneolales bacterium]
MTDIKRILGVDVGLKKVGLAQSDVMAVIATPVGTFTQAETIDKIREAVDQETVEKVIVGWPVSLRGHEGESTRMVTNFITLLKKKIPDLEVITLDERFTSKAAQQTILDSGAKKKKRRDKKLVDAVAAAILLQNYLDRRI